MSEKEFYNKIELLKFMQADVWLRNKSFGSEKDKQIFKNTSEQKPISFIIDTQAKQKKTKIENLIHPKDIRKYNIKDTHVNVNEFKYYNDEQMRKKEEDEQKYRIY